MSRFAAALAAVLAAAAPAWAQLVNRPALYSHGTTALEGTVVFETAGPPKRPGVLLAHEQGPTGAATKAKAAQLAKLGYVVLVADLYGKGVAPRDVLLGGKIAVPKEVAPFVDALRR